MKKVKKGLKDSSPQVQALFQSSWNPSPQLIQGVMNSLKVSKQQAMDALGKISQMSAFMKIPINQIPEKTILAMIISTNNIITKKNTSNINNKQGLV